MTPISIPSVSGVQLAGLYTRVRRRRKDNPVALILGPHYSTTCPKRNWMQDCLMYLFFKAGFDALTFAYSNPRGIEYPEINGNENSDLIDAKYALQWLRSTSPNACQYWVAGVDYGAYMATQVLMRNTEIDGFICVSLPCNLYDFGFLAPCPAPGLLVHGATNMLTPIEEVEKFVKEKNSQKERHATITLKIIEDANHRIASKKSRKETMFEVYNYLQRFHSPDDANIIAQ